MTAPLVRRSPKERLFHWDAPGPRPEGHPELSEL